MQLRSKLRLVYSFKRLLIPLTLAGVTKQGLKYSYYHAESNEIVLLSGESTKLQLQLFYKSDKFTWD